MRCTRIRNSADAPARRVAYQRIQDKLAESAATANPLVLLGRTIVTSPSITGVTFSQDPYARYVDQNGRRTVHHPCIAGGCGRVHRPLNAGTCSGARSRSGLKPP